MGIDREVAIIGVGITKFGELWDKSLRTLMVEAGLEAIKNAGISSEAVDALYGGNMSAGQFISQEHLASLFVDSAGLASHHIPATRIEAACASGGLALRQAYMSVASGFNDIVIVGGVEKMTDVTETLAIETLATAGDQEWEAFYGATFPSLYALMARMHMHKYGTTREQLAMVAVKNHFHGSLNPKAQFRSEITVEKVINSPIVAEPLRMFDCAPVTDGAAALVLCSMETARNYTDMPIKITGSGQASDFLALSNREDITTNVATVEAGRKAFKMAGKTPKDVDVAEVHDSFTIAEIMAIEDLGFVGKGEGGKATEEGLTSLKGEIPINTSGGMKARGHPPGATGVAQVVEIVTQLRGEADKRQVEGAEVGLTHNVGGTGSTVVVHILEV